MEGKGTQLWTLSGDVQTYERNRAADRKNLLNGRLVNSFSPEQINAHTLERTGPPGGLDHLVAK